MWDENSLNFSRTRGRSKEIIILHGELKRDSNFSFTRSFIGLTVGDYKYSPRKDPTSLFYFDDRVSTSGSLRSNNRYRSRKRTNMGFFCKERERVGTRNIAPSVQTNEISNRGKNFC